MPCIVRVKKNKNYFAVSNIPFQDKRLSWEARGMIGYLLSKPDDWTVMFNDLMSQTAAGKQKTQRILKELETNGYLVRERKTDASGKFFWESTVYEDPTMTRKPVYGSTIDGKTVDGSAIDGKPSNIISTELPSTESQNTEKKEEGAAAFDEMQSAIERLTGIMPAGPAGIKAIDDLIEMKATKEDIERAYAWIKDNGKKFRYYSQLVGPARTAISIRHQEQVKPACVPTGGQYGGKRG